MDCNLLPFKSTSLRNTYSRRQVRGLVIAMRLTEPKKVLTCVCVCACVCVCVRALCVCVCTVHVCLSCNRYISRG